MHGGHDMSIWNIFKTQAMIEQEFRDKEAEQISKKFKEEQAQRAIEEEQQRIKKEEAAKKRKAAAEKRKAKALEEKRKQKLKTPKEIATEKGEPYISVLSVELDKTNVGNGSFELDWNDIFVRDLRAAGYPGKSDEDVVDMWFRSICRNVLAETFEQDVAQKTSPDNVRYINRTIGPDGKTEVS
jgi:arginyl-tRNA synthetase